MGRQTFFQASAEGDGDGEALNRPWFFSYFWQRSLIKDQLLARITVPKPSEMKLKSAFLLEFSRFSQHKVERSKTSQRSTRYIKFSIAFARKIFNRMLTSLVVRVWDCYISCMELKDILTPGSSVSEAVKKQMGKNVSASWWNWKPTQKK